MLKEFRGLAAATVANFLDDVRNSVRATIFGHGQLIFLELIRKKLHNSPKFRQRTIRVLRSLCGSWGVLPASYTLLGEVTVTEMIPWTFAGFGEIWCGTWGCEKVAVKVIKITGATDPNKLKKVCGVGQQPLESS